MANHQCRQSRVAVPQPGKNRSLSISKTVTIQQLPEQAIPPPEQDDYKIMRLTRRALAANHKGQKLVSKHTEVGLKVFNGVLYAIKKNKTYYKPVLPQGMVERELRRAHVAQKHARNKEP